ncbi:MAG: TIGR02757 family protein [Phycisphaerae bacterium]|nr:TIGR02757 family protein [Phycisphaerae bacterium]
MPARAAKDWLDEIFGRYHRRELVHPDPLEFLYRYAAPSDREIVALIASSLAYGRVARILKSVSSVLDRMSPSPTRFLERSSDETLHRTFADFKHRFTTGDDLADMLGGVKRAVARHGSLHHCFRSCRRAEDDTVLPALARLVDELGGSGRQGAFSLLPSPAAGSACKRLNLFMRWMVRRDDVDPGGWDEVPASCLVVPLDTHMFKICRSLRLTRRRQPDLRAAVEITEAFRKIVPEDPVRYDFALTRIGIREETEALGRLRLGVQSR